MSAISVSWLNVSWGAVYIETNYGLMQHSYIEIKDRLLNALDSEYNVVDMATVFDVVAVLEKTPITPEILESTRLGKVINECRRRTKNEVLARRAKHLVRRWRNMIPPSTSTPASSSSSSISSTTPSSSAVVPQQNGTNVRSPSTMARVATAAISPLSSLPASRVDRVALAASISPALYYGSTSSSAGAAAGRNAGGSSSVSHHISSTKLVSPSSSVVSSRSPLRDPKVESVPKTHVANKRLRKRAVSPISGGGSSGDPPTKVAKMNGVVFVGQHHEQQRQLHHPHHHQLLHQVQQRDTTDRLLSPPSTFGSAAFAGTSADHHLVYDGDNDDRLAHVHQFAASVTAADTDDALSETPAALVEVDDVADHRHLHHHHHHYHHHHATAAASMTMPEPEPDPPPSMAPTSTPKKRSRKKANKKKMSEDDIVREKLQALSKAGRVKTTEELVAELKSLNEDRLGGTGASTSEAVAPSPLDIGSGGTTVKPSLSNNSNNVLQRHQLQHAMAAVDGTGAGDDGNSGGVITAGVSDTKASLDHLDPETRVEREIADILAKLPPINPAEIRWDETPVPSPPSSPAAITEADVDRYLSQQWDGVNGCVTHSQLKADDPLDNGFREWHEMVSRRTTNDDLIHILPYSIVD